MRKKWIFFVAPPMLVIFIAIGGEVVQHLWNWLLPALFGWQQITFWQAIGLLALCRILFGGGGFGGGGWNRSNYRRRMAERWEKMTPEEREKLGQGLRPRCGGFGAPTSETNEPA
jgi:hypothetical protein